jgi:hypothetical protein
MSPPPRPPPPGPVTKHALRAGYWYQCPQTMSIESKAKKFAMANLPPGLGDASQSVAVRSREKCSKLLASKSIGAGCPNSRAALQFVGSAVHK